MTHRQTTVESRTSIRADACEVVRGAPTKDLAAELVARRIGTSTRQLQRAFEHDGMTFEGFRAATAMDHAAALLRTTDLSVRETASAVGYRQPAAFAKAFRRRHAMSPGEYRRTHKPVDACRAAGARERMAAQ